MATYSVIYENRYGRVSAIQIEAISEEEVKEKFYQDFDVDEYLICSIRQVG